MTRLPERALLHGDGDKLNLLGGGGLEGLDGAGQGQARDAHTRGVGSSDGSLLVEVVGGAALEGGEGRRGGR